MQEVEYSALLAVWLKEKKTYMIAMERLYSDIFKNYCSKTMQQKVETHPDFNSDDADKKIENNPIILLKVVKELVHDQVRAQYHFASGWSALHRFTNLKQEDHESFTDYHKRFKQSRDIIKTQLGKDVFNLWVTRSKAH